jgi:branched-chain amino acid transport system substrate-binding protein
MLRALGFGIVAISLVLMPIVGKAAEPIKIGLVAPFSGEEAFAGRFAKHATTLAAEEINKAGGVLGRQIELIYEDDESIPTKSVAACRKLAYRDQVNVLMAAYSSSCTLADIKVAEAAQIPTVTWSLNWRITEQGNNWVFRHTVSDKIMVVDIVRFVVKKLGFKKIALVTFTNEWGKSGKEMATATLEEFGLKPVADVVGPMGQKDWTAQVLKVIEAGTQAAFLQGDGYAIQQRFQLSPRPIMSFGAAPISTSSWVEQTTPEAYDGSVYSALFCPTDPQPKVQDFVKRFKERWQYAPDLRCAGYYDAVRMIAQAIRNVGGSAPKDIAAGMRNLKNWEGVQGKFSYDEKGEGIREAHIYYSKGHETFPLDGKGIEYLNKKYKLGLSSEQIGKIAKEMP